MKSPTKKLPDGSFVQHVALIDKNRIMRAYNASPSREKNCMEKMTLKEWY